MRMIRSLLIAAAVVLAAAPVSAQARTPASDAVAHEAISQVRSPYCPGLMLEVCPSPQAELLRDSMYAMAAAGMPAAQIVDVVIARHGERWRGLPRRSGVSLWAWVMPPLVLLLGVALIALKLARLRRSRVAGDDEPAAALSPQEQARLDAALLEYDRAEAAP
jgi:cytochrome c-type biogenesis protein CcmH